MKNLMFWVVMISLIVFGKYYANDYYLDRGYMNFNDTSVKVFYEEFPVHNDYVYETFKQIEKNDFNENYKFTVSEKKTSPLTILRIIRLITIGVN